MSVDARQFEQAIQRLVKQIPSYLEGLAEELSYAFHAYVEENFHETAPSAPGGKGNKLHVRSGALTRSFIPGQPGNATVRRISNGVLKLVLGSTLAYAKIHEKGGFVRSKGKMEKRLMALYMKTRQKLYLYTALAVKKKGGITLPARPFVAPAAAELERVAPDFVSRSLTLFLDRTLAAG